MATAEEILAGMTAEETQQVLVIDNDLRRIAIPEGVRLLGVTSDDDVLRLRFTMPRVYDEVDLSGFAIRINYLNAGSEGDVYPVDDAQTDGDVIRFTWLVGRHACKFAGDVRFIVCLKRSEGGEVAQEYNTTLATLPVLEGLETGEAVAQAHPDVIEAILKRLDTLENSGGVSSEQIANAVAAYLEKNPVESGATAEQAAQIEANRQAIEELKESGVGGITHETDPTVPEWAKQPSKPTYTAGEVGARPDSWTPSASDVGADAAGTASGAVAAHNVSGAAHEDLRALIEGLTSRLNALADSDDTTLDQLSEIVAYIKSNRTLIDAVTTGKVSVSDIVDNLTTNASGKVLSAAQGVALKAMIDGIVIPTALPNPQPITINGQRYDGSEAVTVTVSSEGGGTSVEIDGTLTQSGKAADAKAVGDQLSALNEANEQQDNRLTALEKSVAAIPGSETSLQVFIDNTDIDYEYDADSGANYTVVRVYKTKLDGTQQYPFVYAPNGAGAGTQTPINAAVTSGWPMTINAGLFDTRNLKPDGIVIQDATAVQNSASATYANCLPLTINASGDLGYAAADADANDLIVNGIVSAVCGFMPIIIDYKNADETITYPSVGHFTTNAQRQIIGQFANGDYAIVTCEGRDNANSDGWTIAQAQTICKKLGLKFAYNLDGGGSADTIIGLKHLNTGTTRKTPTLIVFNGTTIPPTYSGETDDQVYYSIQRILTGCTSSGTGTTVKELDAHKETLTAEAGYTLDGATVAVTMGGVDVTESAYADGVVNIASVTGDIVITATAVATESESTGAVEGIAWTTGIYPHSSISIRLNANAISAFMPNGSDVFKNYNGVDYYLIPVPANASHVEINVPDSLSIAKWQNDYWTCTNGAWTYGGTGQRFNTTSDDFVAGAWDYLSVVMLLSEDATGTDTSGFRVVFS